VKLRLFAAAREAAGHPTVEIGARTVGEALKVACERFGPRFEEILSFCTVVIGEEQYSIDAASGFEPDEVAVLPPVSGGSHMADVGDKPVTRREAVASCRLTTTAEVRDRLLTGDVPKGDAVGTARIAGILAAKRVPELVPLCHPVRMDHVGVEMSPDGGDAIVVTATVRGNERTGFEIEALTAASIAALTLYDMAKSEDPAITIDALHLVSKSGGKSGEWTAAGGSGGAAPPIR